MPEDWNVNGADKVADTIGRLAELPAAYRHWVRTTAVEKSLRDLLLGSELGPGDWSSWEALVSKCERELARRAEEGGGT